MDFVWADWPATGRVNALTTTRLGGVSRPPFDSLNLGGHVGDMPAAVASNRDRLLQGLALQRTPQWLEQVHGTSVVKASDLGEVPQADACWTDEPGLACIVMTADCLPVFFTDSAGSRVAVAHAGWRGLAGGVLEQTLKIFATPSDVMVWLGPAIGPLAFEVGEEVRQVFVEQNPAAASAFVCSGANGKYLADLYQLSRIRLSAVGVKYVSGGNHCTYTEKERFYSYRRDGQTGRMVSLIWLEDI